MKKLLLFFVIAIQFLYSPAQSATLSEVLIRLKQYSAKDVEVTKKQPTKEVNKKVQEMLSDLEVSVELSLKEKNPPTEQMLKELVRVSVLTFKFDHSQAATELILPLYNKNQKAFEKAIRTLPKKEQEMLRESLKNTSRELSEGNG